MFKTSLITRTAELMVVEGRAVRSLAYDANEGALWVSTEGSHVTKWQVAGADHQGGRSKAVSGEKGGGGGAWAPWGPSASRH